MIAVKKGNQKVNNATLTREDMKRLAVIAAGPHRYMTGGRVNEKLERGCYVRREGDGLWVTLTITDLGRTALAAAPAADGGRA